MTEYGVYLTIAVLGTVLFVLKLLASLHGFDGDFELDADSDEAFEIFSIQSLLSFLMGSGWAGLALHSEYAWGSLATLIGAGLFGVLTAAFGSGLMYLVKKLDFKPVKVSPKVGDAGVVYLSIPTDQAGQVRLSLDGKHYFFHAVSDEAISSSTPIKVVEVLPGDLVKVQKV